MDVWISRSLANLPNLSIHYFHKSDKVRLEYRGVAFLKLTTFAISAAELNFIFLTKDRASSYDRNRLPVPSQSATFTQP